MGLPIVESGYRAQLLFASSAQTRAWSTKFDYKGGVGNTLEDFSDAFTAAFEAAWVAGGASLQGQFYVSTILAGYRIYALSDPLQGEERATGIVISGSGTNALPAEVAAVTSLRTANLGRAYRGRQFWGGLDEAMMATNGTMGSIQMGRLRQLVEGCQTLTGVAATYDLSVMRRTGPDGVNGRYAAQAEAVTTVLTDVRPDTQRRRGLR